MTQPNSQDRAFPLAELALQFLARGDAGQPLVFTRQGPEALDVGLNALFSSGCPAAPALEGLLGLAWVLDEERQSPTAAQQIRRAIQNSPRAMACLGISRIDGAALRRGTARLTGGADQDRAPVFGSAAPKGALKAASVIDPLAFERSRVGGRAVASAKVTPGPKPETPKAPKARRNFGIS